MKIKWLGHASFLITSEDGTKIITDPYVVGGGIAYGEIQESAYRYQREVDLGTDGCLRVHWAWPPDSDRQLGPRVSYLVFALQQQRLDSSPHEPVNPPRALPRFRLAPQTPTSHQTQKAAPFQSQQVCQPHHDTVHDLGQRATHPNGTTQ